MILDFSVENFRSFNQKQKLSFIAGSDRHNADNIYGQKPRVLKSLVVFGANASGKSNLVKAMAFMEKLVTNSATKMNEGDTIEGAIPFRLLSSTIQQPSTFEIRLLIKETHYRYGFSVTRERVTSEWLWVQKPRSQERKWLERTYDVETAKYKYECDADLKKYKTLLSERTRSNSLALSAGVQQNIEPLKALYSWFHESLYYYDFADDPNSLIHEMGAKCLRNPKMKERVALMLQDADIQINNINVKENTVLPDLVDSISIYGLESRGRRLAHLIESHLRRTNVSIQTQHEMSDTKEKVWFELEDESNGTQRFLALAGVMLEALDEGRTLIIDEFECNMHPHLARNLIAFFQHPDINKTGAQLVVTTHDSTLMHPNLLRRDQIWLAEKDEYNATTLYSLNDIEDEDGKRGRSTEMFQRHYLAGEYGGVPVFGKTFEYPQMPRGEE